MIAYGSNFMLTAVEVDFRWDEKADPPRSTLCCVGLQTYASSMWAQNGRRIGL
jgi:hypothetical protein